MVIALAAPLSAEIPAQDARVAEGRALLERGDAIKAGDLFKAACDKKVGEGCYWQARVTRDRRYPPATLEAHYALKEKSCALNFGQGCFSIAIDYRAGSQGLEIDKAKGNAFMQKSCDLGWGSGCGALASDYRYGFNAVAKDQAKAFSYVRKGCDAKQPSAEACEELATHYADGRETEKNLDLALETIKKAYELNPESRSIKAAARVIIAAKEAESK